MKTINKIKVISIATVLIFSSCLSACSGFFKKEYIELPADPVRFEKKDSDTDDMMIITFKDKDYMPYGTIKGRISYNDTMRECLGYVDDDKNTRVYTLFQDPYDNYLMILNVSGIMEQPEFWRKCETRDQEVFTPEYIDSFDYEEWKGSGELSEMPAVNIEVTNEADNVIEIAANYNLNGRDGGVAGVRNADRSLMKKGEDLTITIEEFAVEDKLGEIDKDTLFDIDLTFSVTADNGKTYEAQGSYSGSVKLGDTVRLTLSGDVDNGYSVYQMAGF